MKLPALLALAALCVTAGCVVRIGHGDPVWVRSDSRPEDRSPKEIAHDNRQNMACLAPGLTLEEVLATMGEGTWGSGSSTRIANPHRRESFPMKGGAQADVLFFYTDLRTSDGKITEDELSPLYLEDGVLVGWGRTAFDQWFQEAVLDQ